MVRFQNFVELESGFRGDQKSWNRNQLQSGTSSTLGIGSSKWNDNIIWAKISIANEESTVLTIIMCEVDKFPCQNLQL